MSTKSGGQAFKSYDDSDDDDNNDEADRDGDLIRASGTWIDQLRDENENKVVSHFCAGKPILKVSAFPLLGWRLILENDLSLWYKN